jgi:hypothetical protein
MESQPTLGNPSDQNSICNKLLSLIQPDGVAILENPTQIRNILVNYCPGRDHQKKIKLLNLSLDEKVDDELLRQKDSISYNILQKI